MRTSSARTSSRPGEALFQTATLTRTLALALALTLVPPRRATQAPVGLGLESAVGPGVALDTLLVADVLPLYLPYISPIPPLHLPISPPYLVADVLDEQRIDPRPIPPLYLPASPSYLTISPRYSTSSVSTLGSPRYDEDGC